MAHHQHHGSHYGSSLSASPQTMPSTMPSISEDEHAGEADEPPDHPMHSFSKTTPPPNIRRSSLLTKAIHTDSESHDESLGFSNAFRRQTSRSSTCSTWSVHTDMMSDDGPLSSPSSPTKGISFRTPNFTTRSPEPKESKVQTSSGAEGGSAPRGLQRVDSSEPTVEQKLGRKRCIMFSCGNKQTESKKPTDVAESKPEPEKKAEPAPRRPCALKFICPSKVSSSEPEVSKRPTRHSSPPPPRLVSPSPRQRSSRQHRDSDTTIKNESPKTARKIAPMEPRKRLSMDMEEETSEATRFHEFASREEKPDDWVQESTCHRSRLTVDDTLAKEKSIRQIGDEAEEEALEEEELDDALSGALESDEDDDDDNVSDAGFQTDDEEGFAESDDESDNDSDYDWWSARRSSPVEALMAPGDALRPPAMHGGSASSLNSIVSPKHRDIAPSPLNMKMKRPSQSIPIRAPSPELPDSTDFVCGTLDEDKPLEDAYMSCLEQRRAAKQPTRAQDIDPTFPDEPIDIEDDDDDDGAVPAPKTMHDDESDRLPHGRMEDLESDKDDDDVQPRGRTRHARGSPSSHSSAGHLHSHTPRTASVKRVKSPMPAPKPASARVKSPMPSSKAVASRPKSPMPATKSAAKRVKSPMPHPGSAAAAAAAASVKPKPGAAKKTNRLRSPPPRALFGHSPKRVRSPAPATKLRSPPPSRRGSPLSIKPMAFGTAFLGQRPQLTHTASLPRSPNPFAYKRAPFEPSSASEEVIESDGDDGEDTATENNGGYTRGAIDIVQGLERKRLRRRQKFYEKYCRKEEKKRERGEVKRPAPGKGAQRMRQLGIECAVYRGKRVLSV